MNTIKTLTREAFKKYGGILEPEDKSGVFTVLCGEKESTGWRIGYVILGPEPVKRLEAHPASMETFEPVYGTSVILVAQKDNPEKPEAFLLDRGVVINKDVWHAVRVLSARAEIKVTENYEVESVYYDLKKPMDIAFV